MEKSKLRKRVALGVILIIIGIALFMKDFVFDKREEVFSAMNLELSELLAVDQVSNDNLENDSVEVDSIVNNNAVQAQVAPNEEIDGSKDYETYVGILEIPKINFSKGFYKKESSLNNVKFNIKILPQSSYPDKDKGNVIIIGHSGNYNNSYFRNLYKLDLDDLVYIKYNDLVYSYKIVNIYTDSKDGTVTVYRDETKSCLTLITCTKDDDKTQTIYILELVSVK